MEVEDKLSEYYDRIIINNNIEETLEELFEIITGCQNN
jgi:hypothetical protein